MSSDVALATFEAPWRKVFICSLYLLEGFEIRADYLLDCYVLNHQGYIFAQQTGTYTFTASKVDDARVLWVGPKAYSGWIRSNGDLDIAINNEGSNGSFTYDMITCQYVPVRAGAYRCVPFLHKGNSLQASR